MSRRILRNPSTLLQKLQSPQPPQLQPQIRLYTHEDALQVLSLQSQFAPIYSKKSILENMIRLKKMAAKNRLAYLTEIQCEEFFCFFVVNRRIFGDFWVNSMYGDQKDFTLYVNPKITKYQGEPTPVHQYCHSFPFIKSTTNRYPKIHLTYTSILNLSQYQPQSSLSPRSPTSPKQPLKTEQITQTHENFSATVIQHCMDHLKGRHVFVPDVTMGRFQFMYDQRYFKNLRFLIGEYRMRIRKGLEDGVTKTQEFRKMEESYQTRLRKAWREEAPIAQADSKKTPNIF